MIFFSNFKNECTMKKLKNFLLRVVILMLGPVIVSTGCSRSLGWCPVEDATNAIFFAYSKLDPKWLLNLEDSCIKYDHGIVQLNLCFSSMVTVDLCDARYLLVDIVENYLKIFNEHYVLSGEIKSRPLTPDDLYLIVTFESYYGRYVDEQYTNQIRMYKGCVTYYDFEAFDPTTDVFHKHTEMYRNTLMIVAAQTRASAPVIHDLNDLTGVPRKPANAVELLLQ